jgi:hypothetical protein
MHYVKQVTTSVEALATPDWVVSLCCGCVHYIRYATEFVCREVLFIYLFVYCFFTIYSRYLKRVISKRDGCEYLKEVPSIDGSLELI